MRVWKTGVAALVLALTAGVAVAAETPEVLMHKDPNCGCCGQWAAHMRANGFVVKEVATRDMLGVKREAGVPEVLASCHTAKVGGYVVEGHVPAADVQRLLKEKPALAGIAAPGMPLGSPGMEVPSGATQRYQVIGFERSGGQKVFAEH